LLSRLNTRDEPNYLREEGTAVREKNFGTIKVEGSLENRKLTITVFNSKGEKLWDREIKAKELK